MPLLAPAPVRVDGNHGHEKRHGVLGCQVIAVGLQAPISSCP